MEDKKMTIAQQLGIKELPFEIRDKQNNLIYLEWSNNYWIKYDYDSNGREIRYENCSGYWSTREYDSNGKIIYIENSSAGVIIDKRSKEIELTINDIFTKSFIDNYITNIKK